MGKRQAQRPKDQEGGFIARVGGAVAIVKARGLEAPLGIRDELAQRQASRARSTSR
jgi:hypothetical protein